MDPGPRYVEKRLLEDHIAKLSAELAERDKIDGEIESCVCTVFERLRLAEAENEGLRARLAELGEDVGRSAPTTGSNASPGPGEVGYGRRGKEGGDDGGTRGSGSGARHSSRPSEAQVLVVR